MPVAIVDIIAAVVLVCGFLFGLHLMQTPRTALWGNRLGALSMSLAILFTLLRSYSTGHKTLLLLLAGGALLGALLGQLVKMIQMPQTVALLNGFGGASSAIVAVTAVAIATQHGPWVLFTAAVALAIGTMTLSGSIIAALKLTGAVSQKSLFLPAHNFATAVLLAAGLLLIPITAVSEQALYPGLASISAVFLLFGILFALRIGGADMPITIAFLNSLSGIAAAVCGLAVSNILLAGVGALVGVAGMILTRIMCRAMNRSLPAVLAGFRPATATTIAEESPGSPEEPSGPVEGIKALLKESHSVVIVPGYGMALAQSQQAVKQLIDKLEHNNKDVKVAIHPVAGRMPGHMNVLLAEVGISYEKLHDLEIINPVFSNTDLVIVVGACDVINPSANTAEGTPIYGMPILNVYSARNVIVCNLDKQPGYSGVDNTLYSEKHVLALWGDAARTVPQLTAMLED